MEPKWQRISFMPATPLGEDGRRVTGSAAHIALSRRAAAEGMVLLKNENETLPLKRGSRVAVFGKAQADYVKGGGGSGDTTVAYVRSLAQGLRMKQNEGKIEIFEPLERFYAENVKAQYAAGATPGKTREPILDDALVRTARSPIPPSSRSAAFPARIMTARDSRTTAITSSHSRKSTWSKRCSRRSRAWPWCSTRAA